jgi:hypothetical protein
MEIPRKMLLEKLLKTLESQTFYEFYLEGKFDSYIRACDDHPTKEKILEEIAKIFNV